jgi:hypothetical protein
MVGATNLHMGLSSTSHRPCWAQVRNEVRRLTSPKAENDVRSAPSQARPILARLADFRYDGKITNQENIQAWI